MGSNLRKRLAALLARDEVRVPLQTTGAVLLAFGAGSFLGAENMSWAVFSALFVVQASVGGTVSSALYRMAGAALGAAVGVAAVMLPGSGISGMLLSLVTGVALMSLAAARWPNLAYGLVTVTIIIVAPDLYLLEGAMEKILAIAIGSVCGMAAAIAVFPVSARRRADQHLSDALRACGRLLDECVTCLVDGEARKGNEADADVSQYLSRAREMSRQARAEQSPVAVPRDMASHNTEIELLDEVERFRYTLTLIDRFSDSTLPEPSREGLREELGQLSGAANEQIDRLADSIVARTSCENTPDVEERFNDFCTRVEQSLHEADILQADRERLIAIKEACGAMRNNLTRLCEQVSAKYG